MHIVFGFPGGSEVTNLPAMQETQEMRVQSLGREDPLEDPLQCSCLENSMDRGACELQSIGWQRVGYYLATKQQCLSSQMQKYPGH